MAPMASSNMRLVPWARITSSSSVVRAVRTAWGEHRWGGEFLRGHGQSGGKRAKAGSRYFYELLEFLQAQRIALMQLMKFMQFVQISWKYVCMVPVSDYIESSRQLTSSQPQLYRRNRTISRFLVRSLLAPIQK